MADRSSPARWRLYVITDERLGRGWSHLQIAEAAIRSGAGSRGAIYRSDVNSRPRWLIHPGSAYFQ
jgi:hypothetical protein